MNKRFSFSIKVNGSIGTYSFAAPVERGYVITNRFCPKVLVLGDNYAQSQILASANPLHGETEEEFIRDCQSIVAFSNTSSESDVSNSLAFGLSKVIIAHINRCGRLIYNNDLLIYMDCLAYLLKAVGFAENEIERVYPIYTKQIVDNMSQYIKEGRTLMPFCQTELYKALCRCAAQ